jgi:hypothetical protein
VSKEEDAMVEIRRIRVDEAALVRELVRAATEEEDQRHPEDRVGISEQGLANLETQFRVGAVHEDEVTLVGAEGDDILGFVCASITRGRATPGLGGEIDWLWARPGPMREQLERQLGSEAVSWLFQQGAGAIVKMDDIRHPKRDLWETLGFEGDVIRFSRYAGPAPE